MDIIIQVLQNNAQKNVQMDSYCTCLSESLKFAALMQAQKNSFARHLITAALPYANGPVHIGHLAGCYIPSDIYVRFLRAQKKRCAVYRG